MAFSLRKMLSNITYFKKSEDSPEEPSEEKLKKRRNTYVIDKPIVINFESTEPDSTSRQCTSLNLPNSVKNYAAKKGSLSDTDLLTLSVQTPAREKRKKCKKLKLDINKATQSTNQVNHDVENTPKHVLLDCKSSDVFNERFKGFNFNKSFNLSDAMSDDQLSSPFEEEDMNIDSLSDNSDSESSVESNKSLIKMCRKVTNGQSGDDKHLIPSSSIESFTDIELDKNEEERTRLLLNYQSKLEKVECLLKELLNEFQFHIEVSKVFNSRSVVTSFHDANISNTPKILDEVMYPDNVRQDKKHTLSDSWNIIMEKEDNQTKLQVKKKLLSMKHFIEEFVHVYLQNCSDNVGSNRNISRTVKKCQRFIPKRVNRKKKVKYFDFPDLREAMINLFTLGDDVQDNAADISSSDESDMSKCVCKCHHHSSSSETDSGLTSKTNDQSMSITSSIGNFSLDSSTLTAYSESLDQIISYNSFQDTSLYGTLLQKAAIERITFYIQVHSIQLKCNQEFESKNVLSFHCPPCSDTQLEENGLLRHILSQSHCEKIHFLYKTAYIKKCVSAGKEIQPSTVLNPMTMYRDENKIVCFGDAVYACSLCFENLIVGESVLMAHCYEPEHIGRREKLAEVVG